MRDDSFMRDSVRNNRKYRILSALKIRKVRRGFTLIEAVASLVLSTVLLYGLVLLVVQFREIAWIDMQVRNAEEYGLAYVNYFTKYMHNGFDAEILTTGFPSRSIVRYIDPDDVLEKRHLIDFQRDPRSSLPIILVDGNSKEISEPFPQIGDGKDHFEVDESSFRMFLDYRGSSYILTNFNPQLTTPKFDSAFVTLEFSLKYRREPSWPFISDYETVLDFVGSTYVINSNWPESMPHTDISP